VKRPPIALTFIIALTCVAAIARAQEEKKSPTSKLFVAETNGDTQIDTGKEIDDLTKKSVYRAQGTVIQSKTNSNVSLVLSNGTGIYEDVNTRIEIRGFKQEPFKPNRTDLDDEPSVSKTQIFIDYGVIGVSTSNMVAGSTMTYETSLISATIRGRQAVIAAGDNYTEISMVSGDATITPGPLDTPRDLKDGQQMIVRPGKSPDHNIVIIQDISSGNAEEAQKWLEYRVLTADDARKMVYFEETTRKDGAITVFDGAAGPDEGGNKDIVAVPVVPVNPPIGPTVSAANLTSR
jgi:hypothetical protein